MLHILSPIFYGVVIVAILFVGFAFQHPHEAALILWHWLGANAYWISPACFVLAASRKARRALAWVLLGVLTLFVFDELQRTLSQGMTKGEARRDVSERGR